MPFTWAYVLLATVVTVVLLPFMAPLIVKGVALKPWSLARPLLALVLLPLVAGFMIRSYAVPVAHKLLPVAKWIGVIVLLVILAFALTLYRQELLGAVGSFAPGALALILILMAVFPYVFSPGLQQNQRSVMAMGMSSRNISAGMAALFGITNPPVGMFMMVVLMVPVNLVFMFICARVFAKLAGKTDAGAGA
jgi:BASS family bile acid:Na+ symporter